MKDEPRVARAGIALALLVLLLLGLLAMQSSSEQTEAAARVAHTHEVIESLQRVVSGMSEAESSLRGYSISHDIRFLEDFEPSLRTSRQALDASIEMTRDNHEQHRLLAGLKPVLARRIGLLLSRRQALQGGDIPRIPEDALRLSDEVRRTVAQAIVNERELLTTRTLTDRTKTARARLTMIGGVGLSFFLVAGAAFLLDREMRQRKHAEASRLRELSLLVESGELLQACRSPSEAFEMIARVGPEFFPGCSGSISTFHEDRAAVEVRSQWGPEQWRSSDLFLPDQCWALRRGQLHLLEPSGMGMACQHLASPRPFAAACVPLIANGELLGALHLADSREFQADTRTRIGVFAEQVALAVTNLELRETLRNQSIRDPLTGLFNRRYTEETLRREIARATREEAPLSLIMIDIDHFKRVNDTFGHEVGDEVLKQVATVLQQQTRSGDVASRLGGEELLVALPKATLEASVNKAEQLRAAVESLPLRAQGNRVGPVTISLGVATYPAHGTTAEELLRAADVALYRAKHEGRNRVITAE